MSSLISVSEYDGEGTGAFVACNRFLVSLLNPLPRLCPEQTASMQKHTQTEECFILLRGQAMLYVADGKHKPGRIEAYRLEPGKIFTVPRGVWHSPVMSPDAKILLVEDRDTGDENSPRVPLSEEQKAIVMELAKEHWLM